MFAAGLRFSFGTAAILGSILALTWTTPSTVRAQPTLEVIATGLFSPRGLAFGPEGALYVAEAGRGGAGTGGGQVVRIPR